MNSSKRVLIAGLFHETHTFIPGVTALADCDVLEGDALLKCAGDASPLGGTLDVAKECGWEIVPAIDIRVIPGPVIADEVMKKWWNSVKHTVETNPVFDGVFLVLHGAMVSQSLPDVEGEMLERLRALVGNDIPICGVTDLHANYSARMAQHSDVLVTYRENPHTDARETAVRAAHILDSLITEGARAVTFFEPTSLIWPPTGTATAADPMRTLEQMARAAEAAHPEFLAVNIHAGYAFSDVPDAGVSFSACTKGTQEDARAVLRELAATAWELRHAGNVIEPSFEAHWPDIERALHEVGRGPVVLVEPSDNIGGGAPGDGTGLLREVLAKKIAPSAFVIKDPRAVAELSALPPGSTRLLPLGGSSGIPGAGPLELEIEVVSTSDGKFTLEDPHSHLASMYGLHIDMGPSVTVRHRLENGPVWILLTTHQMAPFDLGQLRSQGIVPEEMAAIGVKAAVAHRRAYDPIARASFSIATPGVCTSDLRLLPFRKVRRPVFPLDEISG